jgi:hypothetical protein
MRASATFVAQDSRTTRRWDATSITIAARCLSVKSVARSTKIRTRLFATRRRSTTNSKVSRAIVAITKAYKNTFTTTTRPKSAKNAPWAVVPSSWSWIPSLHRISVHRGLFTCNLSASDPYHLTQHRKKHQGLKYYFQRFYRWWISR